MQPFRAMKIGVPALLVAACGGGAAVKIDPQAVPTGSRWNATVATPANLRGALQVTGSGWMGRNPETGETQAEITIQNAAPGGVHPWHVHRGQCGNDQGIFGPADAYEPLTVSGSGRATQTVTLPVQIPRNGSFFLNVHASPDNMSTIIACGNLAPPSR